MALAVFAAISQAPAHADELPRRLFQGRAFDACSAPALSLLRRWHRASPYRALGIYVGGANRACRQPRLTADWVASADDIGWRLLPLYVGLQAPCRKTSGRRIRLIDPHRAYHQGREQADDAMRHADDLGLAEGSPLYLDLESYPRRNAGCRRAVLDFVAGWSDGLRDGGYWAGFYSSADSGIADIARAEGKLVDVVWYAHWDGHPGTERTHCLHADQWYDHERIHQYRGNVRESYGGIGLTVDRNSVDAPVAILR